MGRRSQVVSPRHVLRDMVLKRGGVMGITEIIRSREFKGHDADEIRQLVYQLRKENKGNDFGYGQEAWELLDSVIFGLESRLRQRDRRRIQMRRDAKERGVADQTVLDNIIFEGKIKHDGVVHKEEIIQELEASSTDLRQAAKSSNSVRETLVEHKKDFGGEDSPQ